MLEIAMTAQASKKVTKTDFVAKLATKLGVSQAQAEKTLNGVLDLISDCLGHDQEVVFTGFGSFRVTRRKARMGVNPITREKMKIGASKSVGFRVGKALKDSVK